jgi:transcriptional regulator GlxA family with amidase domain
MSFGSDCYLIDRAVLFMRKSFSRPEFAGKERARQLGVPERYLFQQWSGQPRTLAQTLLDIWLNAARHLLRLPPLLVINVIAHRCGFADPSHFSRCFRPAHGMSPRQYRRLAAHSDDEDSALQPITMPRTMPPFERAAGQRGC